MGGEPGNGPSCLDNCIVVAVPALEYRAVLRGDGIDVSDAEELAFSDRDPSFVRSLGFVRWGNYRQHEIPRLQPVHLFLPHEIASRETVFAKERPTVLASPAGTDLQGAQACGIHPGEIAHTQRVERMRLREAKTRPIPVGAPPTPAGEGHAKPSEFVHQGVAGGIHCRRIAQRGFRLCFHFRMSPLCRCPIAFLHIAVVAGEHEIGHAVGAASTLGQQVVDLKGNIGFAAIDTSIAVFHEHIRPDLPPHEFATLVVHSRDLWILEQLHIEADTFDIDARHRCPLAISACPAEHVAQTRAEAGWEPPLRTAPVLEAWLAIAQVSAPPPSTGTHPLSHRFMNLLAAVADFGEVERVVHLAVSGVLDASQSHPGALTARIDLQHKGLEIALLHTAIFEANDEW